MSSGEHWIFSELSAEEDEIARSLYICYFGVNEPLVQTQVIPYLRELVRGGHKLTLLTFEPGEVDESAIRAGLVAEGIEWRWLRYHKRPSVPATLFDIANAARFIRMLNAERKFDILHARSHVPMMMAALSRKISSHKPKLLFDIRGFMPEEYVDAGVWGESGAIYKNFKRAENWLMKEADGFVVLTERARELLSESFGTRPVEVIPCCVDLARRFSGESEVLRRNFRSRLAAQDRYIVVHVGALGGLYLVNEIADILASSRERNRSTFALVLTQSDPQLIEPLLLDSGFGRDDYYISRVSPNEIEGWLYAADAGLSIVKATYATASRSPTKIPEYLAAGLPIIANAGVGDVDLLIKRNEIGAVIQDFSKGSYMTAFDHVEAIGSVADRARMTARREFDIEAIGGVRYNSLYRRILLSTQHFPSNS